MRGLSHKLLWVIVLIVLLAGCRGREEDEYRSLPPIPTRPAGATIMSAETVATIRLRGLPAEIMVDEAGGLVVASGLENVGVGTYVLLEGGGQGVRPEAIASYTWSLDRPPNSNAQLDDPASPTPTFIPDLTGQYLVQLTIANAEGTTGVPTALTIRAGTWVGNGHVRGASDSPYLCVECHAERVDSWRGTRHAVTLQRAMEGQASPFYFENCIHCHTVGKNESADNSGFDDIARQLGWTYPEQLQVGNYARFVAEVPQLANLGNTQCENCHGPGSGHEEGGDGKVAISLRPELCIQCHDFMQQDQFAQWVRSGHADTSLPQLFPDGIDNPICSGCHTTNNLIATMDGTEVIAGGEEMLSCQACHDPHAAKGANIYQIRRFGSIQLPDGTNMMNMGESALCIQCHNVGETPDWVEHEPDPMVPPPQSAAAEMLAGVGGFTYGQRLDNSPHARATQWYGACVECHMVSSTGEAEGDVLSATMNEPIGEHTFFVRYDPGTPDDPSDDYENLRACRGCHGDLPRINSPADADYDGDGAVEGVQDEVQGLLDLVRGELVSKGMTWSEEAPYWGPAKGEQIRAAVYNWSYVNNDGSRGIHNTARAVELLQLTYRQLSGDEVPGAALRSGRPPETTLRERLAAERSVWQDLAWPHIVIPLAVIALLVAVVYIVVVASRDGRTIEEVS